MALKPREIKQRRKENVQKRVSSRYQRRYQDRAEGKTPEQQKAIQERMFGRMQERLGGIQGANPFGAGYDASMIAQAPTWQRPPAGPLGAGAGGGANAPQTGPGGTQPPFQYQPGFLPEYTDPGFQRPPGSPMFPPWMPPPVQPGGQIQPQQPFQPIQPGFGQYGGQFPPWMFPGNQQGNPFQGGRQPNPFGGMQGRY